MRVNQQPAYILLNRPYSESSWIVEVFSRNYGRLALMAKGARRPKSIIKGVLLPFQPLLLSWTGKGEIPTLTSAEIQLSGLNIIDHELVGDQLVCGFYCNELIMYLLHRHDPHAALFDRYHSTILGLYRDDAAVSEASLSNTLRDFERIMIKETGYEVSFTHEAGGKVAINQERFYKFQNGQGFVRSIANNDNAIPGRVIIAMQFKDIKLSSEQDIAQSKHLMRDILSQTLGYKKINSRELFFPRSR